MFGLHKWMEFSLIERVLILDNEVQIPCSDAQMKMPIFLLDSSFGEVQDRSKDHLDLMSRTFILNLFKICASRPEGLVPQQLCHTLSLMDILVNIGGHFHSYHPHTFLSPHLIGSITLEALLFTHGKISITTFFVFGLGFLQQRWPALTLVNTRSN